MAARMTANEAMAALAAMGSAQTKKTLMRHGAREPLFGVKVGDMKKLQRKIKVDQELAVKLFASGNADAQYFAGLIADPTQCSPQLLDQWVLESNSSMVAESMVAAIAAESGHGMDCGLRWIESADAQCAASGWATLNHLVSITPDDALDIKVLTGLLERIPERINQAPNRTRSTMNNFVIGSGCFVAPLTDKALEIAGKLGKVEVDVGDTACKIPLATDYINKVVGMGRQGKKRPAARC